MSRESIASQLVGVWRLVSYTVEQEGHEDSFPVRRRTGGTPAEYQQAGSGYIAYCEVDEEKETVTHIPSVALVPNLISNGQLRSITLSGDRLSLYAMISHSR
jgi:hypothetical protein